MKKTYGLVFIKKVSIYLHIYININVLTGRFLESCTFLFSRRSQVRKSL